MPPGAPWPSARPGPNTAAKGSRKASAQAASTDLLALVDGDTATQLRSRLESKITSQRAAGETDSADAWQETLDLVAQWQGYAGEFEGMVSDDISYAAHVLAYEGDPSLNKV